MDADYFKLPTLEDIYLEDSWITKIDESATSITFTLEAVLTETHPEYTPPKAGERYCYQDAVLEFTDVTEFQWQRKDVDKIYSDATGTTDHGNVDTLGIVKDGYYIGGIFGELKVITDTSPKLTLIH